MLPMELPCLDGKLLIECVATMIHITVTRYVKIRKGPEACLGR